MSRRSAPVNQPTRPLLALLIGAVIVPGVLSLSVGIVALVLWREGFDIALSVLVLCFAVMAIVGGAVALLYVRRSARLAELQSEFVANVSHELRTPVAGIRLMAETLQLERATTVEQRREVLERLTAEVDRLEALVDRILRWRRLASQRTEFDLERLDVSTLVAEVVQRYSDRAQRAGGLEVSAQPHLPPVLGDRDDLTDAVANLIDNALKFGGDSGPVELAIRQREGEVMIEVRDEGPGVPKHEQGRIVERFYRAALHRRSRQGTGLGLAIVDGVVRGHGGRLEIASEPGIGSVFTIVLPAAPGLAADRSETKALIEDRNGD